MSQTPKRYLIQSGVGSGFMVIDLTNGWCLGWYKTRYQANKARRAALSKAGRS